jgi:hypothetical protein
MTIAQKLDIDITPLHALVGEGSIREKIYRLEASMADMESQDLSMQHYFMGGMYARELFIPKGTVLTGAVHLEDHINICAAGDISVMTEEGFKRIKAPAVIPAKGGSKRAGYAHEDTVWITLHATKLTTVEEVEATLVKSDHSGTPYSTKHKLIQVK